MDILDFWICQPDARTAKSAPNWTRLAQSVVDLLAQERPGRARAITRGAHGYSIFLDMSA